MNIKEDAANIVQAILSEAKDWPFHIYHAGHAIYVTVNSSPDPGINTRIFVEVSVGLNPGAKDRYVAQWVANRLNAEYRKGKRDFDEDYVKRVKFTAWQEAPRDIPEDPPPRPPKARPPTKQEREGVELIQQLQKMAGIDEPFEDALAAWRSFTDQEKETTRRAAIAFRSKDAKHRLN